MRLIPLTFIFLFLFSFAFVSSETWKYNYLDSGEEVQFGGNYTINTNFSTESGNAFLFDGYSVATLWNYYTTLAKWNDYVLTSELNKTYVDAGDLWEVDSGNTQLKTFTDIELDDKAIKWSKYGGTAKLYPEVAGQHIVMDITGGAEHRFSNGAWYLTDNSGKKVTIWADNGGKTKIYSSYGDIGFNDNKLSDVLDPTADQDAATKKYVDDNLPDTYWDRTGTTLSPKTSGDSISSITDITQGGTHKISQTGLVHHEEFPTYEAVDAELLFSPTTIDSDEENYRLANGMSNVIKQPQIIIDGGGENVWENRGLYNLIDMKVNNIGAVGIYYATAMRNQINYRLYFNGDYNEGQMIALDNILFPLPRTAGGTADDFSEIAFRTGFGAEPYGTDAWNIFVTGSWGSNFLGGDNIITYEGTGKDVGRYFDGTDWIFEAFVGSPIMKLLMPVFIDGNLNQTNGNATINMIYGEIWGRHIGNVDIASSDVYYNVTNVTLGHSNGFGFNTSGNGELIVQVAGVYQVTGQFSFGDGANTEYHLALGENGDRQEHCHTERKIGTGGDVGSASFTCIDDFAVGDELTLMIENVDNTNDPEIHSLNLNLVRIGN